jgi:hypothetical protein
MNKLAGIKLGVFLVAMLTAIMAHAYPGESIVRDPATGDYIITYWNTDLDPPGLETTTFVPATKIVPTMQSRFSADGAGSIVYRYTVASGVQSKQVLGQIILDPVDSVIGTRSSRGMRVGTVAESAARKLVVKANKAALSTPAGWDGSVAFGAGERADSSVRIGWDPTYNLALEKDGEGIKPGSAVRGFGFSSNALPGIIAAELSGDSPVHGWSGEGPPEDSAILQQLNEIEAHDFVPRNVAVPTIAVPEPFDAALLLDRIRTHVATWPGKQLLDPAFAAQLDRYMIAAADAYRLNNAKAGKENIKAIRKLLEHEHQYLDHDDEDNDDTAEQKAATRLTIDRLAARVLDFDLRYVLKRTEHDHEETERKKERD